MPINQESRGSIQKFTSSKQIPFTQISNDILWDKSITPKARLILCAILSLPDNWEIRHGDLQERLAIGERALNTGLDELVKAGYATRERVKDSKGRYAHYDYQVCWYKAFASGQNPKTPDCKMSPGRPRKKYPDKTPSHDVLNQTTFSSLDNAVLQTKETKNRHLKKKHTSRDCGNVDKSIREEKYPPPTYQHSPQSPDSSSQIQDRSSSSSSEEKSIDIWEEIDKQRASNRGPFADAAVIRWLKTYGAEEVYQAILHTKKNAKKKPEAYMEKCLKERWWEIEQRREKARFYEKNRVYSFN